MKKKRQANIADQFIELEAITEAFERGEYEIDDGLAQFERGLTIAKELKRHLRIVEKRVEVLKRQYDDAENNENTTVDKKS